MSTLMASKAMNEFTPPESAATPFRAGFSAYRNGQYSAALNYYHAALLAAPGWFEPRWHAGACCYQLRRYSGAIAYYRSALSLNPKHAVAHYHLAKVLKDSGDFCSAVSSYQDALNLTPQNPEILYSLGLLHLLRGDWLVGWDGYELRWQGSDRAATEHRPVTTLSLWQGEDVKPDSGIVVYAEQGMGDSLMCFRYAEWIKERFARVKFAETASLVTLLQHSAPKGVEVVTRIRKPLDETGYTHFIHSMSLPATFRTTPCNVPSIPYLQASYERLRFWQQRLATESRLKVGLVWRGGKLSYAPARDMDFSYFAPLLGRDGIRWVSLQKDESPPVDAPMDDWMNEIGDMADTAALVANLDLIISVDTAVAHLAGALGKPVWLLNRFESEWRWMRETERTPWYPSMRIFSQPTPGDWGSVIKVVSTSLNGISQ